MSRRGGRLLLPALLPALCVVGACLFAALAVWQFERRAWKLDLIERVEARASADPVALPPRSEWDKLRPRDLEYLRVYARGRFLHERETLVDAVTERGPGSWVMTPLRTRDGVVLVNRGFVPPDRSANAARLQGQLAGEVLVVGLARLTEPDGRVLRPNRPAENRWFSRDVEAIASARGLRAAAPFFIDAGSVPNPGGYPIGGMTVVRFRNTHLLYGLTWASLALMCLFGLILILRHKAAVRREHPVPDGAVNRVRRRKQLIDPR